MRIFLCSFIESLRKVSLSMIKTLRRVSTGLMVSVSLIALVDALQNHWKFKSGVRSVRQRYDDRYDIYSQNGYHAFGLRR